MKEESLFFCLKLFWFVVPNNAQIPVIFHWTQHFLLTLFSFSLEKKYLQFIFLFLLLFYFFCFDDNFLYFFFCEFFFFQQQNEKTKQKSWFTVEQHTQKIFILMPCDPTPVRSENSKKTDFALSRTAQPTWWYAIFPLFTWKWTESRMNFRRFGRVHRLEMNSIHFPRYFR